MQKEAITDEPWSRCLVCGTESVGSHTCYGVERVQAGQTVPLKQPVPADWKAHVLHIHAFVLKKWPAWSEEDVRFLALALCGEAGELANIVKKEWRGDFSFRETKAAVADELADVRIYLELLARGLNVDLDDACRSKLDTLYMRWPQAWDGRPK